MVKRIHSLRTYLLYSYFPILILLILVYSSAIILLIRDNSQKAAGEMISLGRVTITTSLDSLMETSFDYLDFADSVITAEAVAGEPVDEVFRKSFSYSGFANIEIIDASNDVIFFYPDDGLQLGMSRSGREYVKSLRDGGRRFVTSPFTSLDGESPVITLALRSGDHIISGDISLDQLSRLSVTLKEMFGDDYRFIVTDRYGVYVSDFLPENIARRKIFSEIDQVKKVVQEGAAGKVLRTEDGIALFSSWYMEKPGFYITIIKDLSAQQLLITKLSVLIIILAAVGLSGLFIILSRLTSKLSTAFDDFSQQSLKIAYGELDSSLGRQFFRDFEGLREAFSTMQKGIRERNLLLEKQAYEDELTGLGNRHFFIRKLKRMISEESGRRFALALIDVDGIRIINALYGLEVGDKYLTGLAERLLQERLTAFRTVGDEFAVIVEIPQDTARAEVLTAARDYHGRISRHVEIDGRRLDFSVSLGISIYPDDGSSLYDLLAAADMSLATARRRGSNSVYIYDKEMKSLDARRSLLKREMKRALINNEFYLVYQPQYIIESGKLRGVEALLRWDSPSLGSIGPSEFIPVAEESGFILELGGWVIEKVAADCRNFRDRTADDCIFSINLSPKQILRPDLIDSIIKSIESNGLRNTDIEIEITENFLIENTSANTDFINGLKAAGIKIALDDFGTGYSSLSYLNRIPFDAIKIDRSFISDIGKSLKHEKLVQSIILTAKALELTVIAEGIEEQHQLDFLGRMECDIVQGFYTGKPQSLNSLIRGFEKVSYFR